MADGSRAWGTAKQAVITVPCRPGRFPVPDGILRRLVGDRGKSRPWNFPGRQVGCALECRWVRFFWYDTGDQNPSVEAGFSDTL